MPTLRKPTSATSSTASNPPTVSDPSLEQLLTGSFVPNFENIPPGPEPQAPEITPTSTADGPISPGRTSTARSTERPSERADVPSQGTASPDFSSPNIQRSPGQAAPAQAAPSQPKTPSPLAAQGQGGGDGTPSVFNPLPLPDPNVLSNPASPDMSQAISPVPGGSLMQDPTLGGVSASTPLSGNAGGLLGGGLGGPTGPAGGAETSPLLLALLQLLQGDQGAF